MLLCCLDERFLYFPCLYHNFWDVFRRQNLLKESYRLMEIRKLLRNYGLPNFNLYNSTEIMVMFWIRVIFGHTASAVAASLQVLTLFPLPDTDPIHPEARPTDVFTRRPDLSGGLQASHLADQLLVFHPADWPRQGMFSPMERETSPL